MERGEARVVHKKGRLLALSLSLSLSLSFSLSVHRLYPRSVGIHRRSPLCLIECGCSTCTPHTCSAHHPQGSPRPDANGEFSFFAEATEEHKRSIDPHFGEPCGTHQGARARTVRPTLPTTRTIRELVDLVVLQIPIIT